MTCNRYFKQTAHTHIHHTQRKRQYDNTGCVKRWALCYLFTRHICIPPSHPNLAAHSNHTATPLAISRHRSTSVYTPCTQYRYAENVGTADEQKSFMIDWWALFLSISLLVSQHSSHKNCLAQHTASFVKKSPRKCENERTKKHKLGIQLPVHRRPAGQWREREAAAQSGSLKTAWQIQPWSSGLSIKIARPRAHMASGTEWCGLWRERGCHWPSMVGLWLSVDTAGSDRGAEAGLRVCSSPLSPR